MVWKDGDPLHFHCILTFDGRLTWAGEYSVGSAIPIQWAKEEFPENREVQKLPQYGGKLTHYQKLLMKRIRGEYRPKVEDIISSLVMDAGCVDYCDTFRDWCEEWGWGSDGNPADLLETYEKCRETLSFVQKCFGADYEAVREWANEL